jgi:hypothetical protein
MAFLGTLERSGKEVYVQSALAQMDWKTTSAERKKN